MAGGMNLATKYLREVDERWVSESQAALVTGNAFEYKGDQTFVVYSIPYAPLNDYTRSGMNRYGNPNDLSRNIQTLKVTQDKGFMVESRRGLGGYIRIVQVPMKSIVYQQMLDDIDEDTDEKTVQGMIKYLHEHDMVSTREGALLMQVVSEAFNSVTLSDKERVRLLKVMVLTLENFS